jgi:hypothetical protein
MRCGAPPQVRPLSSRPTRSLVHTGSGPYNVASLWLNYQSRVAKVLAGLYPDELEKRLTKPQYAAVMERVRIKMEHAVTNKQKRESTSCR